MFPRSGRASGARLLPFRIYRGRCRPGRLVGRGACRALVGAGRINRVRNFAGIGESIGYWLTQRYPDFKPRRVLDIGTQSGNNLLAYRSHFPDIELYGIDVAAPCLRYGPRQGGICRDTGPF